MFDNYVFPIVLLTFTGLLCSVMLAVASKFMSVQVDERATKVRECLPGANCGACGFAGCDDYAKKLCEGAPTNLCVPGGDSAAKKIADILGVEFEDVKEKYAIVRCNSDCAESGYLMDYHGQESCAAASMFFAGRGKCSYGCTGYGDCVAVCKYDAIHIVDGVARVDKMKCAGCGLCAKACPKHLIDIINYTNDVYVACMNKDKGVETRKQCKNGCIGCKKCERTCPNGAIAVTDNLAAVDQSKCVSCGLCVAVCPTNAIRTCLDPKQTTPPPAEEKAEEQTA